MRTDFAAMILTHGRPDRVKTFATLRARGYTGRVIIVVDDEDETLNEYRRIFGKRVYVFSKEQIAKTFDEGDNFNDRRAIVYARNASFQIAKELGLHSFVQLDDDYTSFFYTFDENAHFGSWKVPSLDWLFERMVEYLEATPFASIAMAQSGDHLGGNGGNYAKAIGTRRKAMNSFVCLTERPFQFSGRINEDVNTYTEAQRRGVLFLTLLGAKLNQMTTQTNPGGMTELYMDSGTYVKSFYSVMYAPSAVKISSMRSLNPRIHHRVNWNAIAPLIVREEVKK